MMRSRVEGEAAQLFAAHAGGLQERGLVGEIAIQRGAADVGRGRNRADGDGIKSVRLRQALPRHGENAVARVGVAHAMTV